MSLNSSSKNVFWTILARVIAVTGQIVFFLLIAERVGPELIGVFALASVVAFSLGRIAASGWQQFATTHSDDLSNVRQCARSAVFAALMAGIAVILIALIAALFFKNTLFIVILVMLMPTVLIAPIGAVPIGVLIGQQRLISLAQWSIVADIVASFLAALTYVNGGGLATLIVHRLAMATIVMVAACHNSGLWPILLPALPDHMLRKFFGTFLLTGIIHEIRNNVSLFIIGAFTGATGTGLFRTAARLSGAVGELANEAVTRLAWATFAKPTKEQDEAERLTQFTVVTFALTAPVFVGLGMIAIPLINLTFGEEWRDAGPILIFLSLAGGLRLQLATLVPTLTKQKNFTALVYIAVVPAIFVIAGMFFAAPFGIVAIGASILFGEIIAFMQRVYMAHTMRQIDVFKTAVLCTKPMIAVLIMAITTLALSRIVADYSELVQIISLITVGILAWLTANAIMFYENLTLLYNSYVKEK